MTDSSAFPAGLDAFEQEYRKSGQQQESSLDFFSFHSPADIAAPHPDLFESELDSSLAGFDLQLLTVDTTDAFSFLRSDTPTCGPPSTITASSESAYESISSESFYNYPTSPDAYSSYSFPVDLEMDFQRFKVDSVHDYAQATNRGSTVTLLDNPAAVDPASFGPLPPTPPRSPAAPHKAYDHQRSSFSDYGAPTRSHPSASYYDQRHLFPGQDMKQNVSPSRLATRLPTSISPLEEETKSDPRKKYRCPTCPRAFARAYNLKTHMATHDPNRLKPHVCPHRTCGRSFSRKHDLGRHLLSIHRDEAICSSQHSGHSGSSATKKSTASIGVEKGPRSWCDRCGKGWVGSSVQCDCAEVK